MAGYQGREQAEIVRAKLENLVKDKAGSIKELRASDLRMRAMAG
jgi:hypothetical protein